MANKIAMNPEELRNRAAQIRDYVREHEEIMRRLTNLVIDIDEVWNGEAQDAYVRRFQESRSRFQVFERSLLNLSESMDESANAIESTDRELAQMIRQI